MKSIVATPGDRDVVAMREVDDAVALDDQILLEVRAGSLNRGELRLVAERPGWRPGQDIAGVVVQAAASGRGPAVGERVAAVVEQGGWAQLAAAPIDRSCVLPEGVSFDDGACLGIAGLTALRALRVGGSLTGARVLVTGASGGVGRFAVQLARDGGAEVTGAVGDASRAEGLTQLGASAIVGYDGELGGLFDVVLDGVCGPVLERGIRALAPGGVAVLYGMASGEPARIGLFDFDRGPGARLQPFRLYQTDTSTFGRDLGHLAGMIAEGRLVAPIGLRVAWTELPAAMEVLRDRRVQGKVVFTVT